MTAPAGIDWEILQNLGAIAAVAATALGGYFIQCKFFVTPGEMDNKLKTQRAEFDAQIQTLKTEVSKDYLLKVDANSRMETLEAGIQDLRNRLDERFDSLQTLLLRVIEGRNRD